MGEQDILPLSCARWYNKKTVYMSKNDASIPQNMERIFLLPGEFYISKKPVLFATLLGSCVSVCIKNIKNGSSAMNHFVRDRAIDPGESDVGRFGDLSTRYIIDSLLALDKNPGHYRAKIFGGGNVVSTIVVGMEIGKNNICVAKEVLESYRIPIIVSNVGGTRGKKIYYNSLDFSVIVRDVGKESKDFRHRDVRVLIVDDSPLVRAVLRDIINATPGMEVCGEAQDAYEARDLIVSSKPDVVSLDIVMPGLNGLALLKKVMRYAPVPIVIVSTIAQDNSEIAAKAKSLGAVGVMDKDALSIYKGMDLLRKKYIPMLRTAAQTDVRKRL